MTYEDFTPEQRRAYMVGMLAGQDRKKFDPPLDAALSAAYRIGFEKAGGRVPPRSTARLDRSAKSEHAGGKRQIVDPKGELLHATLATAEGRKMVKFLCELLAPRIQRAKKGERISMRLYIEMARDQYGGSGMPGDFKLNNNVAPSLTRWILLAKPSLRGVFELRGETDPRWTDPELALPPCPFPWFDPNRPLVPKDVFVPKGETHD